MSLGLVLPTWEQAIGNETSVAHFGDQVAIAKLAAEIGYDVVWLPDHFITQEGQTVRGVWDCWTLAAGIAAAVPGMAIGTMVACTSFHNPGSIAKMAEMLSDITGGNFVLGLGPGWHEPEFTMFGFPYDHLVGRFEEALQIISPLVRTGNASFAGQYYDARDAVNLPRSAARQEGGPPIVIGSEQPRMLRLTARYADAWDADWQEDPQALIARMNEACREVGRDPEGLLRTGGTQFAMGDHPQGWHPFRGSHDEMVAVRHAAAAHGLRSFRATPTPCTLTTLADFGEVIAAFDQG